MRTIHWRPMLLLSLFLIAGTQAVWAQGEPGGQYFYQRDQIPYPYGDPNLAPNMAGMGAAGYPPGANPWPQISPYGPAVDQSYYQNGFWFNRIISGNSRYFTSLDVLFTATGAPPHALIGADGVNNFPFSQSAQAGQSGSTVTVGGAALGSRTGPFFETTGRVNNPDRNLPQTSTGSTNGTNGTAIVPIFNPLNAGVLPQRLGSGGIRGTWGWWNPDDSGFMVQGFWQDNATVDFQRGDVNTGNELLSARTVPNLAVALLKIGPYFGLPLPGADRDADGFNGVVVPYDLYVLFRFQSNIYGGNLDWYFSPLYDRDYFKIRGLAGARILQLNEVFSFQAADSGLGYTFAPAQNTSTGGGTGTSTGTNPFDIHYQTPDAAPYDIPSSDPLVASPITSFLQSRTQGIFAGPEVGLRFDVGGERTRLFFTSKFGLLAYQSHRTLSGYNIGDHYNIINNAALSTASGLPQDPDVNGDGIPDNPTRAAGIAGTSFSTSSTTTSVAPMFEQGVQLQSPLLSYVPIVNKMSFFDNAQFQVGYSILLLGNVYRPTNDIQWAQFPQFPSFTNDKTKYYTQNWNLGVSWTY